MGGTRLFEGYRFSGRSRPVATAMSQACTAAFMQCCVRLRLRHRAQHLPPVIAGQ
jgi:hypothetical protein